MLYYVIMAINILGYAVTLSYIRNKYLDVCEKRGKEAYQKEKSNAENFEDQYALKYIRSQSEIKRLREELKELTNQLRGKSDE